jgi:hypothetical protein
MKRGTSAYKKTGKKTMALNLINTPDREELKPRITVFGVGGAGGNAVNNMIEQNLEGVEFVVANTDAQALQQHVDCRRTPRACAACPCSRRTGGPQRLTHSAWR